MKQKLSLAVHILVVVGLCVALNAVIFVLDWDQPQQVPYSPPGYVFAVVWIVLFTLLAVSRWLLRDERAALPRTLVTLVIVLCLAYPFYTIGLDNEVIGLIGTLATLVLVELTISRAYAKSRFASYLLIPLAAWLLYAAIITFLSIIR